MIEYEMDLSSGKYLKNEICAFSGDWLVVWDGKYNYYLFNSCAKRNISMYERNRMPSNDSASGNKNAEFYTIFDTAIKNLCEVVGNNGFFSRIKYEKKEKIKKPEIIETEKNKARIVCKNCGDIVTIHRSYKKLPNLLLCPYCNRNIM